MRLACAEALELLQDRMHKIDGVRDQHAITVVAVSTYEGELPKVKPGFVAHDHENSHTSLPRTVRFCNKCYTHHSGAVWPVTGLPKPSLRNSANQ